MTVGVALDKAKLLDNGLIIFVLALFGTIVVVSFFVLATCEANRGHWDNIAVECVPKGELTTWERWFPSEDNRCREIRDCLKGCKDVAE